MAEAPMSPRVDYVAGNYGGKYGGTEEIGSTRLIILIGFIMLDLILELKKSAFE